FIGFYGAVMGSMCLLGWWLAPRDPTRGNLDRLYLAALLAGLVLFYLALPVLFAGLFVLFVPLLGLALLSAGGHHGNGAVSFDLMRASGGGLKAVLKAMFARPTAGHFALRKRSEDCPALFAAIEDVARRVGTEPPDQVCLPP